MDKNLPVEASRILNNLVSVDNKRRVHANTHSQTVRFVIVSELQVYHVYRVGGSQKLYSLVNVEIANRLARPTRRSGATVS